MERSESERAPGASYQRCHHFVEAVAECLKLQRYSLAAVVFPVKYFENRALRQKGWCFAGVQCSSSAGY